MLFAACFVEAMAITAGFLGAVHPLIDLISNFQVPLLCAGAALLALCLLMRSRAASVIALALCLVTGARLAPLWFGGRLNVTPAAGAVNLRVMSANVLAINGRDELFLGEVRRVDPDVLVMLEFSEYWAPIAQPLSADFPYSIRFRENDNPLYGVAIFSKLPLRQHPLPVDAADVALRCVDCDVTTGAGPVRLIAHHAMAPISPRASHLRDAQLAMINRMIRSADDDPLIVAGDCNATPWSHGYRALKQGTDLHNARFGFGVQGTWRTDLPAVVRLPIDHVLVSEQIGARSFRVGNDIGSDHLPVIVDMQFGPDLE